MAAGALDIILGAKKIEDVDSNTLEKVASAFQVGAGVSGIVTGGATLAGLIGVGGATAMGVTAGVGGVFMSVFSMIGLGIGIAAQEKKLEQSVEDTAKDFDQWNVKITSREAHDDIIIEHYLTAGRKKIPVVIFFR